MTIETYKVEAVTEPGYMEDRETVMGYSVFFNITAENITVNASAFVGSGLDKSFSQWNDYFHVVLGIKKD